VLSLFSLSLERRKNMQQYQYDGPVMRFDDCVQHRWKATTVAPTEAKAKSNLAYR
jgi:hypothetical protein